MTADTARHPRLSTHASCWSRKADFLYDSDSFADDVPYYVQVGIRQHLVVPYSFVTNDSKFAPCQSCSLASSFLGECVRVFDYLLVEGEVAPKTLTVGLHPRIVGQPARTPAVREFIERPLSHEDVWFARQRDIVQWWIAQYESTFDGSLPLIKTDERG
ncbi:hypothetical protein ACFRIB_32545 [Streptomyces mirabilis]|uniref:hypothetical protein n=1 Tax=Streptomyces mirabilis TaxID=68239 RepID=UPI003692CC89